MEVLNKMNAEWPAEKRLNIGIGLNTGIMTVGNMGSVGTHELHSDGGQRQPRRAAGRHQQAVHRPTIIISESTYAQVKDKVIARELDNIRVKGKNKPTPIFELIDVIEGLDAPPKIDGKGRAGAKS